MKPMLCLDFDGVLHSYSSGWQGAGTTKDDPVPGAIDFLVRALDCFDVAIFSSRSKNIFGRMAMKRWLYLHLINWEWNDAEDRWQELLGVPADYTPFTHGDIDDVHRECARKTLKKVKWPWFKPPALVTIDDRAVTFTGEWPDLEELRQFKPWNK